jgi:hypothetical protein
VVKKVLVFLASEESQRLRQLVLPSAHDSYVFVHSVCADSSQRRRQEARNRALLGSSSVHASAGAAGATSAEAFQVPHEISNNLHCTVRMEKDNNDTRVIAKHHWHASMHAQHALVTRMSRDPTLHPRAPLAAYAASHRLTHLTYAPRRPRCGAQCACAMLGSHLSSLRVNPHVSSILRWSRC